MEKRNYHSRRITSPLIDDLIAKLEHVLICMQYSSNEFNAVLKINPSQKSIGQTSSIKRKMEPYKRSSMELPEPPHQEACPKIEDMELMLEMNRIHVRLGELITELEKEKGLRPRS